MPTEESVSSPVYLALAELGLSDLERKLYTASLSVGSTSVAILAQHLSISRPNVYKVIRGLEAKGLATFEGSKHYTKSFQVASPSVVMLKLREKQKSLNAIDHALNSQIADLLAKYEQGRGPANIRIIRGIQDFRDVYTQAFEEAQDEMCFFGSYADFINVVHMDFGNERIARRIERKISARLLTLPSPEAEGLRKNDAQQMRQTRFLVGAQPFTCSFYFFANKAIFWQPATPLAIIIEDIYLVTMWKSMFELLWAIST